MNKYKRFIWMGIVAIAVGGFAMFNVSLNLQNNDMSRILMINAEALTTESGAVKK
jgi:hypothetical protein